MYHITPVLELFDKCGYEVSYMCEDLVFTMHNTFLVQLDNPGNKQIFIYFNRECEEREKETIMRNLSEGAPQISIKVVFKGTYNLSENQENEELHIEFNDRGC